MTQQFPLIYTHKAFEDFRNLPKANRRQVKSMINKIIRGDKKTFSKIRIRGAYHNLDAGEYTIVFAFHRPSLTICILRIFPTSNR